MSTRVRIPTVTPTCGATSDAAVWVGLGGNGATPFTQNGFTLTPTSVALWYEVFDSQGHDTEVNIAYPGVIHAGDLMHLEETFTPDHEQLTFVWADVTQHRTVQRTLLHARRYYLGRTAEWIVEHAPYDTRTDYPRFARFAPITFSSPWALSTRIGRKSAARPRTLTLLDLLAPRDPGRFLTRVRRSVKANSITVRWHHCI